MSSSQTLENLFYRFFLSHFQKKAEEFTVDGVTTAKVEEAELDGSMGLKLTVQAYDGGRPDADVSISVAGSTGGGSIIKMAVSYCGGNDGQIVGDFFTIRDNLDTIQPYALFCCYAEHFSGNQ